MTGRRSIILGARRNMKHETL